MQNLTSRPKKIIICGLGKQAELTHHLFTHDSKDTVVAFCLERAYLEQAPAHFFGLPVAAFETLLEQYPPAEFCVHIAIGRNHARQRLFEKASAMGYSFASYISAHVRLWPSTVIGEHVFIDQYTWIHPYVTIADNSMLIGARVGHHSYVGPHSLLSSCILGGSVTIGEGTFVGMGVIINDNVTVGHRNIIGSGCLIARSTPDDAVYSETATKQRAIPADRVKLFSR